MPRAEMRCTQLIVVGAGICLLALAGIRWHLPTQACSGIEPPKAADESANANLTNRKGFLETVPQDQARVLPTANELSEGLRCLAERDPVAAVAQLTEVP